jgi:transcriptional regulator NrdR family protein
MKAATLEKRAEALEARARKLRVKAAKKRRICPNCGERFHVKPKLADDGYVPGWLCNGAS